MIFEKQVVNMYKGMIHTRCDDTETVFYFSATDFPGLEAEPYSFVARAGHTLKGYIYRYADPIPGRLIVFDHGFGGGHRAYMKEIELLCKHGYTVFSYDHTGCMESGGASPNGLAQSLCDLNDCICAIKSDPRFAGVDISVMGHSWGAFSTMNIAAIHPEITHIVAISGFVSVEHIINQNFSGLLKLYRECIMNVERETNPDYVHYDAITTLKNSNVKALLVYSDDDKIVKRQYHYDELKRELSDSKNVTLMLVSGKGHNPNYTADAVSYKDAFFEKLQKLDKKKKLESEEEKRRFVASFDWKRMTAQDEALWDAIISHLK